MNLYNSYFAVGCKDGANQEGAGGYLFDGIL
jgi:hypothetical protein